MGPMKRPAPDRDGTPGAMSCPSNLAGGLKENECSM